MERYKTVVRVIAALVPVNLLLFALKLYIGLSTNSIAIYSDAVNNLFDALSCLVTAGAMYSVLKHTDARAPGQMKKTEQLFSFLLSIVVALSGFYFAYCSLERFMYPTPVWYTWLYPTVLSGTAAVKLGMFFFLRAMHKKDPSPVLGAVCADSLLDFFITLMTILTLLLSAVGTFSFDALFGLVISVIIIVSAVKSVLSAGKTLVNYVPQSERDEIARILSALPEDAVAEIRYEKDDEKTECLVYVGAVPENAKSLQKEAFDNTQITMHFIEKTEVSQL